MVSWQELQIGSLLNTEEGSYVVLGLGSDAIHDYKNNYVGGLVEEEAPLSIHISNTCSIAAILEVRGIVISIQELIDAIERGSSAKAVKEANLPYLKSLL
jgi:hypothetical protein